MSAPANKVDCCNCDRPATGGRDTCDVCAGELSAGAVAIEAINPRAPLLERFHQSYMPVTEAGCWLWIGATNRKGYGRLRHQRKGYSAHRISYELHHGSSPGDLCVLHKCDTPACVNPLHLRLGTNADNMADRNSKGRTWGRLKPDDVRGIRFLLLKGGMTRAAMGRVYGVSEATVCAIYANKVWRNIP